MLLMGFPLLLIPFTVYNIFAFLFQIGFTDTVITVHMMSGADWAVSSGDMLIAFAVLLLYLEILKAARFGTKSIVDHLLSMLLFIGMLVEFLMLRQAGTSTFFILMIITLVDVVAGFIVTARTAQRDMAVERIEHASS
jgi:hypothetical protein